MTDETRCPKCGAAFPNQAALMGHAKAVHAPATQTHPVAPPAQLACKACGMGFPTQGALGLHARTMHMKEPPANVARSIRPGRLLAWGAVGGLAGGLGLAGVMAITGQWLGLPVTMLAVIAQAMFGVSATSSGATTLGLGIHLLSSLLIGVALTGLVIGLSRASPKFSKGFFPASGGRIVSAGLLGGFLVFLVFGLPLMFAVLVPTMHTLMTSMIEMMGAPPTMAASMATTKLSGWMPGILTGFFVGHLVYGLLLAGVVSVGVRLQLRATGVESPRRVTQESSA